MGINELGVRPQFIATLYLGQVLNAREVKDAGFWPLF